MRAVAGENTEFIAKVWCRRHFSLLLFRSGMSRVCRLCFLGVVTNPGVTAVLLSVAPTEDQICEWETTRRRYCHTALCVGSWLSLDKSKSDSSHCHSYWLYWKVDGRIVFLRLFKVRSKFESGTKMKHFRFQAKVSLFYLCVKDWNTFAKQGRISKVQTGGPLVICRLAAILVGSTLCSIKTLPFVLSLACKNYVPPSDFLQEGENNVEMTAGFPPACLAELTGLPVTAKDSAAFDLPGG